jgi:hypothetical protein
MNLKFKQLINLNLQIQILIVFALAIATKNFVFLAMTNKANLDLFE